MCCILLQTVTWKPLQLIGISVILMHLDFIIYIYYHVYHMN